MIFRFHRHTHVFVSAPTQGYGLYVAWTPERHPHANEKHTQHLAPGVLLLCSYACCSRACTSSRVGGLRGRGKRVMATPEQALAKRTSSSSDIPCSSA